MNSSYKTVSRVPLMAAEGGGLSRERFLVWISMYAHSAKRGTRPGLVHVPTGLLSVFPWWFCVLSVREC